MKHNSAIKVLKAHLEKLTKALEQEEKKMDEPEMTSDYEFALNSCANIEYEIIRITESMEVLIKLQ